MDFLRNVCSQSRQMTRFSRWIHMIGPSCSGKTTIIRRFLDHLASPSIYIDCREVAQSEQRIFTYILNNVRLISRSRARRKYQKNVYDKQDREDHVIVKHTIDFLNELHRLTLTSDRLLIVFDNADKLKLFKTCEVLPILENLFDYDDRFNNNLIVQVVTVCKIPFWHLSPKNYGVDCDPVQVCLPRLSEDDTLRILENFVRRRQELDPKTDLLKAHCLDFAVRALYHDLNLTEMKSLIENQLVPILDVYHRKLGDTNRKDQAQAFKDFKATMSWRSKTESLDQNLNAELSNIQHHLENLSTRVKFLIIAAFLASYNQPSADARFFLKKCDKRRVSRKAASDPKKRLLKGPSIFTFERLLFIYVRMCDLHFEDPSPLIDVYNEILMEISSLCSSKLLCRTSNDKVLSSLKLKCLCPYSKVKEISCSINFDLDQYLFNR
uniref:Origin recognition complex subunit 5 n=1 Tax=Romanomermis culicivorax TaxID=13658 RepID=A0A915I7S5_ROMCU